LTSGKPCQRQEQYAVAKAYLNGYGVTKTIQNLSCGCVVLPTLVIHQHNIFSVICIDGDSALPLITAKQKKWYKRAAEQGHPPSQYSLGIMCLIALGIPRDYKKAARWFHEAVQPDHPSSQFILCRLYISGKGIVRDPVHATRLFEKSAKNN